MRRRMNQYPSNHQQYHNPHEGYHHHNQYGGYPQQPYYQPNPQPYYDPHRQGYQNEGYYESRNPTLFYLLIVLAFVAYGVYYLNKNYGTTGLTGESTFEVPSNPDQGLNSNTTTPDPNLNNNTTTVPNDYDYSGGIAPPEEITDVGEGFSSRDQRSTDDMYNEIYVVETPDQPSTPVRTFYVQEHVYENWDNAKKQQEKLISEGRKVIVVQFDDGSLLYRLIVGEFTSEAEAIARAQKLKSGRIFELVNGRIYEL